MKRLTAQWREQVVEANRQSFRLTARPPYRHTANGRFYLAALSRSAEEL